MSESNKPQTKPRGPRKLGKIIKRALLLTLLAVTAAVAVTTYLARSEPAYWKEHQAFIRQSSPEQIEQLADEVQTQLDTLADLGITQANTSRVPSTPIGVETEPDGDPAQEIIKPENVHINRDQALTLTNPQLAAVVQSRLDGWMQDRGYEKPNEITDPMVAVDDGKLVMAFNAQIGSFTQVVSGKFKLKIHDDGMAELSMTRFLVGKLPVPANAIGKHLRKNADGDPRAAQVGEWLEKLQHIEFKPVIEIENRRRIRVMDYKLLESGLELTVRIQDHKTYKAMNQALAGVAVD